MEESIEARVPPERVWEAWEKAHALHSPGNLEVGQKGAKGFKYQVLDVKKGESFTILWKSLFTRLIFSHSVQPTSQGCKIHYRFQIKGPFSWFLRKILRGKIRKNLASVLQSMVKQLEQQS